MNQLEQLAVRTSNTEFLRSCGVEPGSQLDRDIDAMATQITAVMETEIDALEAAGKDAQEIARLALASILQTVEHTIRLANTPIVLTATPEQVNAGIQKLIADVEQDRFAFELQ